MSLARNEAAHRAVQRKRTAKARQIQQRQITYSGPDGLEIQADIALQSGDFRAAERGLARVRGERELHAILKLASIPFYRLDHALRHGKPVSAELASDTECVHADLIEVLRVSRSRYLELEQSRNRHEESHAMQQLRGFIGECSVAALMARRYNNEGRSFMLPAQVVNDKAPRRGRLYSYGIDGVIERPDPTHIGPHFIQIKNSRYSPDPKIYTPSLQIIYTHDLPNGGLAQRNPATLSQLLIDDVDATISSPHLHKVEAADTYIDNLINPQQ